MRENRDGVVKLHDIDEDIFEKILEFLYTGKDVVSEENAEKIFRAASLMQIPCLQATYFLSYHGRTWLQNRATLHTE
jgi:hypothetical protein